MASPVWVNHSKGPVSRTHYNEQAIAEGFGLLHWGDIPSLDLEQYEDEDLHWKAESELEKFSEVMETDQLVVTFYNPLARITIAKPDHLSIVPATETELLEPIPIEPCGTADIDCARYEYIFKAICFDEESTVEISPADAPALFDSDLHPRHWAACDWGNINAQIVENAHAGEPLPYEPSSLTPTQVEICCEEYLRVIHPSFRRLSILGGQQKDVDVIGSIGENGREVIVGEITGGSTSDAEKRRDRLRKHEEYAEMLYLFAPADSRPDMNGESIEFVSLRDVFERLDEEERTEQMLRDMLMYRS